MNSHEKSFHCSRVLLFILGSSLVLGSYFIFNRYSLQGSKAFSDLGNWRCPDTPLELSQGDKVTVEIVRIGYGICTLTILNTGGKVVFNNGQNSRNFTAYYYVQANDFYYCNLYVSSSLSHPQGIDATYYIGVVRNTSSILFLITGAIVLLAGAVTVSIAFLYNARPSSKT